MANLGYIQLLRICNQRCLFCSNPENSRIIDVKDAQDQVLELKRLGYQGVIFTGGEPTMYEHLPRIIAFAADSGVEPRIITNGQLLADAGLMERLKEGGLALMHVSLHSSRREVQDRLTGTAGSFKNILKTLGNAGRLGVSVDINMVINSSNADHLDETVAFIVKRFPFITHFVWNNIDPRMNRVAENPQTVAQPPQFELSLWKAMRLLAASGRTFRVERVPLCYMTDFAHCSTETRKIVKGEERLVNFLDDKGQVRQTEFFHGKAECCALCSLTGICAGMYAMGEWYDPRFLYPLFLDPEDVKSRIKARSGD